MFAASTERFKRAIYPRGALGCIKCGHTIHVYKVSGLAAELSLRCPHCGTRGFYDVRMMAIEEMPERRQKPRR